MGERDPWDDLRDLADSGAQGARPLPPGEIRARGERRGRRRRIGAGVAVLCATVLIVSLGIGLVGQGGLLTQVPDPAERATVTAAPGAIFTEANLPAESDLEWQEAGDWRIDRTYRGAGQGTVSECFPTSPDSLGAAASFTRTFRLFESDFGSATALRFDTAQAAAAAYETLVDWGDACPTRRRELGHQQARASGWTQVATTSDRAQFQVIFSDSLDNPDDGLIEEYGLIQAGARVGILTYRLNAQDHNWSTEVGGSDGLDSDPMIRSLPKAAARLAGVGVPSNSPSEPPVDPAPESPDPSDTGDQQASEDPTDNASSEADPDADATGTDADNAAADADSTSGSEASAESDAASDGASADADPAPASRRLSDDNEVAAGDLPTRVGQSAEPYSTNARPDAKPSLCLADGLDSLEPVEFRTQGFRYVITDPDSRPDPDDPLADRPTVYATALQFEDEAAATRAYDAVSRAIESCGDALTAAGYQSVEGGPARGFYRWYGVRGDVPNARFSELIYQEAGVDDGFGYFEAVGLVRVEDRIAVTTTLTYGMDSNFDTDPDAGVAGPHPLAELLPIAADRLTR